MAFCPSVNFGNLGFGPAVEQRQKQLSPKVLSDEKSLTKTAKEIPDDLLILIVSRLPVKSIARFRCLSRQWASILCSQDFNQLYMKRSLARPCLLFVVELNGKFVFFSAPQHIDPDKNSSPLVPDCHMSFPAEVNSYGLSQSICGWLCSKDKHPMMCNPSTGWYIDLPNSFPTFESNVVTYFGYDPVDELFKVLRVSEVCRVLTLGTGDLSWRIVDRNPISERPVPEGICINGVLYYIALSGHHNADVMLVCFDLRSEKFSFLFDMENVEWESTLINFKGKLGVVRSDPELLYNDATTSLEIFVLDNLEDEKWSKHIYELPPLWSTLVAESWLYLVGMTVSTGELVFAPFYPEVPFCIFRYNLERNTLVRVEIQLGVEYSEELRIHTFIDHVGDVNLKNLLGSP